MHTCSRSIFGSLFVEVGRKIYIQTQHDANLLNAAQIKAKAYITRAQARCTLFVDDSALVAYSIEDMQKLVDNFARIAQGSV